MLKRCEMACRCFDFITNILGSCKKNWNSIFKGNQITEIEILKSEPL